jgi:hypothetical protein
MVLRRKIWIGLLFLAVAGTGGCSVQDPDQPPAGSISVGARKDSTAPNATAGKTKSAAANRQ